VSQAGSIAWFAGHEARLAWRDWLSLMTAGRGRRSGTVLLGFFLFAVFLHGMAYLMLVPYPSIAGPPTMSLLVNITVTLLLSFSLMLSQAMESVTRAFYARADLDLLLSSPVAAWRLFAVRVAAMAVSIVLMTLGLGAPFINMLAWRGGARWLCAYGVAAALAMTAVAVAVVLTVALFRAIGPRRTRLISQILAAVIGAGFLIGLQFFAILSYGSLSRLAILQSGVLLRIAPDAGSMLWWPARAAMGDPAALAGVLGGAVILLVAATYVFAPRFATFALAATGASRGGARSLRASGFHTATPAQALRRKERVLLLRDPWLLSQTLMQLLYLLPPAFLLWRSFYGGGGAAPLLVPVLVMAAGQTGGGLAWLAISGEDAPDLIASAPVAAARVLRAKTEAVMSGLALVFAPLVAALALAAPFPALVAAVGVVLAAASATAIQFWFRKQAKRSHFRSRQTSSRIATFAEALASISWAGTGALAASGIGLAVVPGGIALAIVAGAWMISPTRS
jgi:ABC-2 type transport system permease protein